MSKIRLDLDALLAAGTITPKDADWLKQIALPDQRNSTIINVMLIFGALAIATAAIALLPNATTGLVLAAIALLGAEALRRLATDTSLNLLSSALAMMGTLGLSGWVAYEFQDTGLLFVAPAVTLILLLGALWFRSSFLGALAVVSLGGAMGTGTAYWHASYGLFVKEPTATIIVFSAVTATLLSLRTRLQGAWSGMATVAGRTAYFLANFGFWVGSLWGDLIGEFWVEQTTDGNHEALYAWIETAFGIPELVFIIGWAAMLIGVIAFARRGGFLSITSIVFLAIHAYTQYFEMFKASPTTILIAGIVLVAGAVIGAKLISNHRRKTA